MRASFPSSIHLQPLIALLAFAALIVGAVDLAKMADRRYSFFRSSNFSKQGALTILPDLLTFLGYSILYFFCLRALLHARRATTTTPTTTTNLTKRTFYSRLSTSGKFVLARVLFGVLCFVLAILWPSMSTKSGRYDPPGREWIGRHGVPGVGNSDDMDDDDFDGDDFDDLYRDITQGLNEEDQYWWSVFECESYRRWGRGGSNAACHSFSKGRNVVAIIYACLILLELGFLLWNYRASRRAGQSKRMDLQGDHHHQHSAEMVQVVHEEDPALTRNYHTHADCRPLPSVPGEHSNVKVSVPEGTFIPPPPPVVSSTSSPFASEKGSMGQMYSGEDENGTPIQRAPHASTPSTESLEERATTSAGWKGKEKYVPDEHDAEEEDAYHKSNLTSGYHQ